MARRLDKKQRGQTLVVSALILLLTTLGVFLTFSIGHRTREKTKLQAMADSGAYSLAVAEARAFNFYAFSNRAILAHYVSILSIHSHQSYITWYEKLLSDVSANYGGSAMKATLWASCLCSKAPCSAVTPCGCVCKPCPNACKAMGKASKISQMYKTHSPGGYNYLHQKWHQDENLDKAMSFASRGHMGLVAALRAQQNATHTMLLSRFTAQQSLAKTIAQKVDSNIEAPAAGGLVSARYYQRAVTSQTVRADDYHEILAGTRWPDFLTQRNGLKAGAFWAVMLAKVLQIGQGDTPFNTITHAGNSKTLRTEGSSQAQLASGIHQGGHNQNGFGGGLGAGAEDHGAVRTVYVNLACICGGVSGRPTQKSGVWSDPQERHDHGTHFWAHGGSNKEGPRHDLGGCSGGGGSNTCGIYQGYMRYLLKQEQREDLWNMPRTYAVLTKRNQQMPWDFNFSVPLPVPVKYRTHGSQGDSLAGGKMAAIAAGLVYYHKPEGFGDAYREPPNLWNPFWRAKLHPVKRDDAIQALQAAHPASANALRQSGQKSVNY